MEEYDSIIVCGIPVILVLGAVMWFMKNLLDQSPTTVDDIEDPEFKKHSYWGSVLTVIVMLAIGMFVLLMKPR